MSDIQEEFESDFEMVKKSIEKLGEHFDSVQIFVTRYAGEDATLNGSWGAGNWFTRFGQVKEWLDSQQELNKEKFREKP